MIAQQGQKRCFILLFACYLLTMCVMLRPCQARNIRVSANGQWMVATSRQNGALQLILSSTTTQDDSVTTSVVPLPAGISGFQDLSIDDANGLVFALQTGMTPAICVYRWEQEMLQLSLVDCYIESINTAPFTGISARDGVCVVSGGTGGMSVFEYDTTTGQLDVAAPRFFNRLVSGVIGLPDVELVSADLAAMSTDFRSSTLRFGTAMVDLADASIVEDFRVEDSLSFSRALGPANFPLVNALYRVPSSESVLMYTANGGITVQDISLADSTMVVDVPTELSIVDFRAVTVNVDEVLGRLAVGGIDRAEQSHVIVFDIQSDPFLPTPLQFEAVDGRITSIGASNGVIAFVSSDIDGIQMFPPASSEAPVETFLPPEAPSLAPISGPTTSQPSTTPSSVGLSSPSGSPSPAPSAGPPSVPSSATPSTNSIATTPSDSETDASSARDPGLLLLAMVSVLLLL